MKLKSSILFAFVLLGSSICTWSQSGIELPAPLSDRPSLVIKHCGYTLSYNIGHGTPNWSAWVLTKSHLSGHEPRSPQFYPDPLVPIAYRVQPSDYTNSGYDRGHMCPAADMAYSPASMHDCFYMSNMCPQVPALNRVSWKALETACRKWVLTEDTLYIVCGPVYKVSDGFRRFQEVPGGYSFKRIGKTHKIDVPTGFYKVILSLRRGHAKAIGFYYTNSSKKQSLQSTARSVDEIERLTGIDFFHSLPDSIENVVESRLCLSDWK